MNTTKLIRDLRGEKGRIERAIAALEALNKAGRHKMSPAARKRISMMMKKRWAARRRVAKKA